MSSIANEDTRVPALDPSQVLKLVRSGLFNYWFLHGNYLINLKLLRSAREDSNQAISKPIAQSLPLSCIYTQQRSNEHGDCCRPLERKPVKCFAR